MSRMTSVLKTPKLVSFVFGALLFLGMVGSAYAIYEIVSKGTWPESWPKQLEPLRPQSRTLVHTSGAIYEIPFADREQFEAAWPLILKLKSKGAPIELFRGPHKKLGGTVEAGVRIIAPLTGSFVAPDGSRYPPDASALEGDYLKIGPPWPDHIKSSSGILPEYVIKKNNKWVPHAPDAQIKSPWDLSRARIDIELVVDGDIVDLNRIRLPADN